MSADKLSKQLENQLNEVNAKLDDGNRRVQEVESSKSRLTAENAELTRQLEEAESQVNQLTKSKQSAQKQLDEVRNNYEEENRQRMKLQGEVRNLNSDIEQLRDNLEEEQEGRADMQRALTKVVNEANVWRQKCQSGEGGVRSEELDDLKRKMGAKLAETESQLEAAHSKCNSLEKAKNRLQGELEDVMIEVERVKKNTLSRFNS